MCWSEAIQYRWIGLGAGVFSAVTINLKSSQAILLAIQYFHYHYNTIWSENDCTVAPSWIVSNDYFWYSEYNALFTLSFCEHSLRRFCELFSSRLRCCLELGTSRYAQQFFVDCKIGSFSKHCIFPSEVDQERSSTSRTCFRSAPEERAYIQTWPVQIVMVSYKSRKSRGIAGTPPIIDEMVHDFQKCR